MWDYNPPIYIVNFETFGGTQVPNQLVEHNLQATRPSEEIVKAPKTTKDEIINYTTTYRFITWYTDANFTTEYDFTTPVTSDITIYADYFDPIQKELDIEFGDDNVSYEKNNNYFRIDLLKNTNLPNTIEFADTDEDDLLELKEMDGVDHKINMNLHDKMLIGANHAGFSSSEIPENYKFEGIQAAIDIPSNITLSIIANEVRPDKAYFNMIGTPHSPVITGTGNLELLEHIRLVGGYILDTDTVEHYGAGDGVVLSGNGTIKLNKSSIYGGRDSEFFSLKNPNSVHTGGDGIVIEAGKIELINSRVHGGNGSAGADGGIAINAKQSEIYIDKTSWVTGGKGGSAGTNNDPSLSHYVAGNGGSAITISNHANTILVNGKVWGGNGGGTNIGIVGYGASGIDSNGTINQIIGHGEIRGGSYGAGHNQPYTNNQFEQHPDIPAISGSTNTSTSKNLNIVDGELYFDINTQVDSEFDIEYSKVNIANSTITDDQLRAELFNEITGEVIDENSYIIDMDLDIVKKDMQDEDLTSQQLSKIVEVVKAENSESELYHYNYDILKHLDISLNKVIESLDLEAREISEKSEVITEIDREIEFTLSLPEHLDNFEEYAITKIHINEKGEEEITMLNSTYNQEEHSISFTTSKFSTFSLVGVKTQLKQYEIKVQVEGAGNVQHQGQNKESFIVDAGSNALLEMTPENGWYLHEVIVDGVSIGKPSSYELSNIQANHFIKVIFVQNDEVIIDPQVPPTTDFKPETGDTSNYLPWVIITVSSIVIFVILSKKKKKND